MTADPLVTLAGLGRYGAVDAVVERELVARLRRGDAGAFDEIYAWMRPRLWSFLARMTGRRDVADDLAQEVWLRLARNAHKLADDTRLPAWLFAVARNLYVSQWRSAQAARALAGELLPPEAVAASPFEAAAESQTAARVERAIAGLPPSYREIVLLCTVEGLGPAKFEARTDGGGHLSLDVPLHAREVRLEFVESGLVFSLLLGHMDPITQPSGVRARLANLGYGGLEGRDFAETWDDVLLVEAICAFQRDQHLETTGEMDDATRDALRSTYGT